jgi:tRNA-(ms[2]io[6]A)-hydroxylase
MLLCAPSGFERFVPDGEIQDRHSRAIAGIVGRAACVIVETVTPAALHKVDKLPLHSRTSIEWGRAVLADPLALLVDHAFLEKKAANNAMELMTQWPNDWLPGWVETMTGVARDETAHLAQVVRLLMRRGGRLERNHKNPYANALRLLVRRGEPVEIVDRLMVAALIEARSCERFAVLAAASADEELTAFYGALCTSELGHYKVFLKLAQQIGKAGTVEARWQQMLAAEARILAEQPPGPRIHSGCGFQVSY